MFIHFSCRNIKVFGFCQVFDERILLHFLHDAFLVGVRQRSSLLILHKILVLYPCIHFLDKGLSIIQNLDVQ